MLIAGIDSTGNVYPILTDSSGRPYVLLSDGTTTALIDANTGCVGTISAAHKQIHDGKSFIVSYFWNDIADNGTARLRLTAGANKELHPTITVATEAKGELDVLEGNTYTGAGTAVVIYDKNRTTANTSDAAAKRDAGIDAQGTKIYEGFIPGGVKVFAVGSTRSDAQEWVWKKSTDYMVRWQNRGGAVKDCAIIIEFYEAS